VLTLNRRPDPVVTAAPQQYAVVVLDEDQASKLLGTPQMRRLNGLPHAYDPHVRYMQLKRRLTAAAALLLVAATGAAAWRWVPRPALAAVFPWSAKAAPTVGTAASFSVAVTAPPSADAAARVAGQLRGLALPVFTRRRPNTNAHQVMVGPYVSLDEAEAAQKFLRGRGYGGGRLYVDESVRNAPRNEYRAKTSGSGPGVLLVGAPDRLSLVLELETQPRRISSNRINGNTFEIEMGPVPHAVPRQQWSAPAGVHLVRHIALEEVGHAPGGGHFVKALVSLPEFSQASVRVDGSRVYVDLTWPQFNGDAPAAPAPPRVHSTPAPEPRPAAAETAAPTAPADAGGYREQVAPSIARFEEMTPFLLSAAKSPSPPVLAALARTLESLEAALAAVAVPRAAADGHALIRSAAAAARTAMDAEFTGDRAAQAQQAIAMFQGGKAALP
jgi:hypothetical protein